VFADFSAVGGAGRAAGGTSHHEHRQAGLKQQDFRH
jgi:hypothetical protein